MEILASPWALVGFVALISLGSLALSRGQASVEGFFSGASLGHEPALLTLVLSQVTTWIFARSLMNSAILGYFYGFAGTLAYTAYYLSFLTGGYIVARLRQDNAGSVQEWLGARFGVTGHITYNLVVGLRLLSEVFANLIVVGLIFSAAFPEVAVAKTVSIIALALIGLLYSARGGLLASLKTDVLQMVVFLGVFAVALGVMISSADFSFSAVFSAQGVHDQGARPGWVLVVVALLQVLSYPAHDPVMMDRGFIASPARTKQSFVWAFVLSVICIMGFGLFGIQAGLIGAEYENQILGTWQGMFGSGVYFLLMASLLVSAVSTLDSALASAARLVVDEVGALGRSVKNGRWVMVAFMLGGLLLTLFPNKTLFDAVAVTGTASMFLTPVMAVSFMGYRLPLWSYLVAWAAAIVGAMAYMYRGVEFVSEIISGAHKYDQLLSICIYVLAIGFAACIIGAMQQGRSSRA
ncbi:sodium:solute symporter [Amylibacter marinus]|uniref:Sodium:solute symporter n=1 Tax=Amylibacter marinus TaxID=1475483 RepID=A0ABQ5VUC6_9RHOB|nr:sodium:proline symporter [Amylibacter marinus]GLQ34754.1 sodium:solute symporter [Amylibacter marinus]